MKIESTKTKILISKNPEIRLKEVQKILTSHLGGANVNTHPDLLYFPADSRLGVEQAREIREFFSIKPYSAKGRVVILEDAGKLTLEAQNALLKTLEEPPEESILILGADSEDKFLPTILSRCQIIHIPTVSIQPTPGVGYVNTFGKDIEKLLNQNIADRFEYIEKLKDTKSKEELLHALINYFHHSLATHIRGGNVNFLKELLQAEEWAEANVNLRGILEYLLLKMPTKL